MGYDLIGACPENEVGEYFCNNISAWCRLWEYTTRMCADILRPEEARAGYFNEGYFIESVKAQ